MADTTSSPNPNTSGPQEGAPQQSRLRVELGFVGTIQLVASPITELTLHRPSSPSGTLAVDGLEKPIVVTGNYKGTTQKVIPASLVWLIHYYHPADYNEIPVPGRLHLDEHGNFQFKALQSGHPEGHPELDVLRHRLFGEGAIGYRLTPQFPHAPSATMPPGLIGFDNPLDVKFEQVSSPRIGTCLELTLDKGWAVEQLLQAGHKVRLVIDEEDKGEGKVKKGYQDLRIDWGWGHEDMDEERPWLIGCSTTSTPEAPRFEYPEAKEENDYEFSYRMLIEPPALTPAPKGKKVKSPAPIEARKPQPLVKVPRPVLESFSLAFEPARGELGPRLVARGRMAGLESNLKPSVDLGLWRKGSKGEGRFKRLNEPVTVQVHAGRFEAELYTLPTDRESLEDEPLWQWASAYTAPGDSAPLEPTLFATVCFNARHLSQPKLPAYASLDFDTGSFDIFDESRGVFSSPEKAGSICSTESQSGSAPVTGLRALFTGIPGS